MKIGFDIGGVLSKYPEVFKNLILLLKKTQYKNEWDKNLFIITDQYKNNALEQLVWNGFYSTFLSEGLKEKGTIDDYYMGTIHPNNVYSTVDIYDKYGEMSKAVLIKQLGLDIFIDDHEGYLQWDSTLGPQPLLLKVQPDVFKPYYDDSWMCLNKAHFGRQVPTSFDLSKA